MEGERNFFFLGHPVRVVFGMGKSLSVRDEIHKAGSTRVFLVCAEPWADRSKELVSDLACSVFDGPAQHTPVEVTEKALQQLHDSGADGIVAFGGGSAIGLGKALALRTGLTLIAVPTTYAGSEMTPLLGQTENGIKSTLRDEAVRPRVVIYDPEFTSTMPLSMSVSSGLNSIAHGVEALYASDGNPIVTLMAIEGIRAMAAGLDRLIENLDDEHARQNCLYGAWLCGYCLGSVSMGLHHKLCHSLGGLFDLPHAEMHSVMLPYSIAYNAPMIPDAIEDLHQAFGIEPIQAIRSLMSRSGLHLSLKSIGMPLDGITRAVEAITKNAFSNPRPVAAYEIRHLLEQAYSGDMVSGKGQV